jgi:5'-nucleotidase
MLAPAAATTEAATAAPAPAAAETAKTPTTHVIAAGDTLWDLAETFYGDGARWRKLANANRRASPRHLLVGQELRVPAK